MGAPALRAGAPSQRGPAPFGRWPPPKKKVYNGKWYYAHFNQTLPPLYNPPSPPESPKFVHQMNHPSPEFAGLRLGRIYFADNLEVDST